MALDLVIRGGTIVDGSGAAVSVNGQVTLEHGAATGNLPGALLRGPGARPAA